MTDTADIPLLLGRTFSRITHIFNDRDNEQLVFETRDGKKVYMNHEQDCCEDVYLEDIEGDLQDLVGTPITMAAEVTQNADNDEKCSESCTWTFYRIGTARGTVVLRWFGQSNGYYSESITVWEPRQ